MDMEIPSTLSEYWGIFNLGNIPGTVADGIPLAGSSRAPRLVGKPSARAPQRPLHGRPPSVLLVAPPWLQPPSHEGCRNQHYTTYITLPPAPDHFVTTSPTMEWG